MDNALLTAVASELARELPGSTLGDVVQVDSRRFAFRFSTAPFRRLMVTLHPDLSALHVARRAAAPREPTELAAVLSERLGGAEVAAVRKQAEERVVEVDFIRSGDPAGTLVVELMGKASNLILLDPVRRVVRFLKTHHGTFRVPREGEVYVPPPPRPAGAGSPPFGSKLMGREVAARVAAGEDEESARADLAARLAAGWWEPRLYTPRPPGEIGEDEPLGADVCFASPFPLASGRGLVETPFATANEAAGAHADLLLRHLLFRGLRAALASLVRAEEERLERLEAALEKEALAARGAGEVRRRAELILASLGSARKEGGEVELVDYFDPDLRRVRVPVDPRLDLKGNAEALFRKARKLDRATAVIARRLAETRARRSDLAGFAERVAAAPATEALEAIESELNRSGLVKTFRKPERREVGRRPSFVKVREYRTSDGFTVLVGRTASENDTLTFKVAAPHDFWLHAAGRAGAHVVVRNPRRARELPETALMEAAGIAAWFSRGDRGGEVEVHVARRKEVRKGKGMSPGMVTLRSFRTVLARPALPGGAGAEEGAE